jgi:hypothetical protein
MVGPFFLEKNLVGPELGTSMMDSVCQRARHDIARGGSTGGLGGSSPPTADASMENGKGEGEKVVEERQKMERKRGRRRRKQPL